MLLFFHVSELNKNLRQFLDCPLILPCAGNDDLAGVWPRFLFRHPEQHHRKYVFTRIDPSPMLNLEGCLRGRREELLQLFWRHALPRRIR